MDLRVAAVSALGEQGQDSGRAQAMALARAAILGGAGTDAGQVAAGQTGNPATAAGATTSAALATLPTSLEAAGLVAVTSEVTAAAVQPAAAMAETNATRLHLQANAWTAAGAAHETPGAPQAEAARTGLALGGAADGAKAALVITPMVPAWITALHAPAIRPGPWPQRPDTPAPRKPKARSAWVAGDSGDDEAERQQRGDEPDAFDAPDNDMLAYGRGDGLAAAEGQPISDGPDTQRPPTPWPAELHAALPAAVQAELARHRGVLLVAPPGRGQRGLQLWMLGFEGRSAAPQPVVRRWAVRGAPAAVGMEVDGAAAQASWQLWRVRREGEDGQRPVLTARSATPHATPAPELVLRATATVLPPPLRATTTAWLDVLEPQRLWRDLGSQWTLLLAWSPAPLPIEWPR